jgi:hypothetical protein
MGFYGLLQGLFYLIVALFFPKKLKYEMRTVHKIAVILCGAVAPLQRWDGRKIRSRRRRGKSRIEGK